MIAIPARAQQKTGPGITGDDSLTWHGVTLYGVIDIGVQYDTHSAPFTPYRPSASGNYRAAEQRRLGDGSYAQQYGAVKEWGCRASNISSDEFAAVFQIETFFNPQSGEIRRFSEARSR